MAFNVPVPSLSVLPRFNCSSKSRRGVKAGEFTSYKDNADFHTKVFFFFPSLWGWCFCRRVFCVFFQARDRPTRARTKTLDAALRRVDGRIFFFADVLLGVTGQNGIYNVSVRLRGKEIYGSLQGGLNRHSELIRTQTQLPPFRFFLYTPSVLRFLFKGAFLIKLNVSRS